MGDGSAGDSGCGGGDDGYCDVVLVVVVFWHSVDRLCLVVFVVLDVAISLEMKYLRTEFISAPMPMPVMMEIKIVMVMMMMRLKMDTIVVMFIFSQRPTGERSSLHGGKQSAFAPGRRNYFLNEQRILEYAASAAFEDHRIRLVRV